MLAGPHNLTMEGAESLGSAALSSGVILDLVLFGTDKIDQCPLERLVEKLGQPSRLHRIPRAMELAGSVREALVGAGAYSDEGDEAMQRAIAASRAEAGFVDDDLVRAIRESAEAADGEGEGDPDVQRAIALSMLEPEELVGEAAAEDEPAADDPARAEEEEAMSPDLLLAMAMSREEPPDHEPNAVEPPEGSDDEADESVQQALAMSIAPPPDDGDDELDLNDPELQRALAMSNEEPPDGDENDPNDPDLRAAIRASLARDSSDDEHQGAGGPLEDNHLPGGPPDQGDLEEDEEDSDPGLQAAILASRSQPETPEPFQDGSEEVDIDEDAVRMSMEYHPPDEEVDNIISAAEDRNRGATTDPQEVAQLLGDPDALRAVLGQLDGVDPNDPRFGLRPLEGGKTGPQPK
jgi:hypothetical protein